MRTKWIIWVLVVVFSAVGSARQREASGESFLGTWTGTWDGEGSGGGFELTLDRGQDGNVGGRVSVTGEPTYETTLRTVTFDGARMTATYAFPPNEAADVRLVATFNGNAAKGTWSLRENASDDEVASGTWAVTKTAP